MTDLDHTSEAEMDYPKDITDAASCLDYLKKKELFLYKMMNDPSHKAMLYFLEVLMNSDSPVTIDQLAARFSHKTFSPEMREACGGGSADGLREFLSRYPSLFNVDSNGHVTSVAIELTGSDGFSDGLTEADCWQSHSTHPSSLHSANGSVKTSIRSDELNDKPDISNHSHPTQRTSAAKSASSLSLTSTNSNASNSSGSLSLYSHAKKSDKLDDVRCHQNKPTAKTGTPHSLNACECDLEHRSRPTTCVQCGLGQLCCDSITSVPATAAATNCLHCPLVDLACHQHHHHHHNHLHPLTCATSPHHHHHHHATTTTTHCICANSQLTCMPHCHLCQSSTTSTNPSKPVNPFLSTGRVLPPLERLTLESEAVRFFQQRLLKREERWIQIKSLAGHLSQARAEIRAIVGPQLEFRNFLLRHPHVFEVQGELVSVRDPLGTLYPIRRERTTGIHSSFSSNNLILHGHSQSDGYTRNARFVRPKSLVLSNTRSANVFATSRAHLESNVEQSRAFESSQSAWLTHESSSTNSAPNTPTGFRHSLNNEAVVTLQSGRNTNSRSHHSTTSFENPISGDRSEQHLKSGKNTNSLSISMSANEYRSIMFVRKVLEKRGGASNQAGVPLAELLQILSEKSPEPVRSTIGWTQAEVEEFIHLNHLFFEISKHLADPAGASTSHSARINEKEEISFSVVKNKRLEKMINIMITGTKPQDSNVRTLTNHCGRIYHMTKLWGIIDLGKHEHVFFDKSIFKNIDDLQKHFKVDEILYFNAILAPKESRAKWRATQVWKECDRPSVEKLVLKNKNPEPQSPKFSYSQSIPSSSCDYRQTSVTHQRGLRTTNDEEDTEAEGEIEEIDVEALSISEQPDRITEDQHHQDKSISEFALNAEEDIEEDEEEPFLAAVAREEGLQLINDIKFITDDNQNSLRECFTSYPESNHTPNNEQVKTNFNGFGHTKKNDLRSNGEILDTKHKISLTGLSMDNTASDCTSSFQSGDCSCNTNCKHELTKSVSSNESGSISIAVQTVSTGDIMASHLYHDPKKPSRDPGF